MMSIKRFRRLLLFLVVFIVLLSIACQDDSVPNGNTITFQKEPYLIYTGDNTMMCVLWQASETASCTIEWGTDTNYSIGNNQTSENSADHTHSYTISNLIPGNKYCYQVRILDLFYSGSFYAGLPNNAQAVKFFAYGDTRSLPETHNSVCEAIISTFNNDTAFQTFILHVGDLVNTGDYENSWTNEFFNPIHENIREMMRYIPLQACMGNHEGSGELFEKYFPYPFESDRYWSFDYGPVHIVVVDQYSDYGVGSDQLNWIENDLTQTSKLWKFMLIHEPGWSAGSHVNNTDVQNYLQPLCVQYDVAVVFGGHNHNYARALVDGIQHITTGGGGAPLTEPDEGYEFIIATNRSNHFCRIEVADNVLLFTAITDGGIVIDQFSLIK